jgi:8-oxo-dGTP diphosphatase
VKLLKHIEDKPLREDKKIEKRFASRAIILDESGLIPILFVSKSNYHKLPGGGIDKGEGKMEALGREILEETGCTADILGEVGKITEYRSELNLFQTSYCYLGKVTKKGIPNFEQGEIDEGFRLVWFTLDEAITQLKKDKPENYEGKFIQKRDLAFLEEVKKIRD